MSSTRSPQQASDDVLARDERGDQERRAEHPGRDVWQDDPSPDLEPAGAKGLGRFDERAQVDRR